MNVSFDSSTARRVRQCGGSGYLARLVRQDMVREASRTLAPWYAEHPTFVEDALAENAAALDEAG